jgi:hypothetical protein
MQLIVQLLGTYPARTLYKQQWHSQRTHRQHMSCTQRVQQHFDFDTAQPSNWCKLTWLDLKQLSLFLRDKTCTNMLLLLKALDTCPSHNFCTQQ